MIENDSKQFSGLPYTDIKSPECGVEQQGKIHISSSYVEKPNKVQQTFGSYGKY